MFIHFEKVLLFSPRHIRHTHTQYSIYICSIYAAHTNLRLLSLSRITFFTAYRNYPFLPYRQTTGRLAPLLSVFASLRSQNKEFTQKAPPTFEREFGPQSCPFCFGHVCKRARGTRKCGPEHCNLPPPSICGAVLYGGVVSDGKVTERTHHFIYHRILNL